MQRGGEGAETVIVRVCVCVCVCVWVVGLCFGYRTTSRHFNR